MKALHRLFLLYYCYCSNFLLVRAAHTLCSSPEGGGVWTNGHEFDLNETKKSNALFGVTSVYNTSTSKQCAADCCMQIKGVCDVASYNSQDSLCSHYHCSPISKCKLYSHNDTDVFFPLLSPGSDHEELVNSTLQFTDLFTDASQTVLHGDGLGSKPRKGALLDEQPAINEYNESKIDNTTVVARKGVDATPLEVDVGNDTMSIDIEDRFTDNPNDSSTVNATTVTEIQIETSSRLPTTSLLSTINSPVLSRTISKTDSFTKSESGLLQSSSQATLHNTRVTTVVNSAALPTEPEHVTNSDTFQAFLNSPNFHLVIGLSLGLVVLMTVMGLVGKRMHDSWQRRHYSRMDFLIDGMYHGEA